MKFCQECGKELAADAVFCNECGTPVGEAKSTPAAQPTQRTQQATPAAPKKPMSKQTKILLISIAAAIIVLFGVHKIVESMMSKDRLITKFEDALHDKDAKAVAGYLSSDDKKLKIDEKSIAGFMEYFDENPDQIKNVITNLKNQSKTIDNLKEDKKDYRGYGLVRLAHDGKFLFYDKYELKIESVYLTVETNYKDTVIYVDNNEVGKADEPYFEGTFGPFVPGYHTVKGTLKTDFIDLSNEEKIFMESDDGKVFSSIYLDAEEITVNLPDVENITSTKLFINGKDVGINLNENSTFGPILTDGSMTMYVEAELPWGTVKTEEVAIDDDYMNVELMNEGLKTTLMETVHQYNEEYAIAYTAIDETKLTTATQEMKDKIIEDATSEKDYGRATKIQYVSTTFDLDSFDVYYEDGRWEADLYAQTKVNDAYYYVSYDEVPELSEDTSRNYITLVYDESASKWLVNSVGFTWGFDDSNVKEYTVEEPKTYESTWVNETKDEETQEDNTENTENTEEEAA